MKHPELDINAKKFWDEMSQVDKLNLLAKNRFWEGLNVYRWVYIPEDLKDIIRRRIEENKPNL
jgi:hypothetical protein